MRPEFKDIHTYEEFLHYYWYREELQNICKSLSLEYVGSKAELNAVIKAYFNGVKIPHKPKRKLAAVTTELTASTPLTECGFTFGPKFRDFYIALTGETSFKFTADMVASAKAVKENHDSRFTLGDLLDIKLGKKTYVKYDTSSCQWNRFLKDFCADENNGFYPNKLRAASAYWKLLRESDLPKVYSKAFIAQYKDKVLAELKYEIPDTNI